MVGVPGRSRACQVCRERRVKCDLIRPICSQCARKHRPCTYERNHIFVNNDEGTHKTVYRKADGSIAESYPPNYKPTGSSTSNTSESLASSHELSPDNSNEVPKLEQLVRRWKAPSLCESLQQALVATAIDDGKYSKEYSLFGLLSRSLALDVPGDLYSAPLACYAVWRGRKDGNINLINASHRFYVQALRATEKALRSPTKVREDVTLAACNALGLFEALECPNRTVTGFRWHRDACCRLIELRGPEAHQSGLGHVLFISMRSFGFLDALERAQPTFLSRPEWMTKPWATEPKTFHDKLVDVLAHGPGLLRKAYDLELPANKPEGIGRLMLVLDIVRDLATVLHELDRFYDDIESTVTGPLFWQVEGDQQEESELLYPPPLYFQDLWIASALTLYWGMTTLVWASLWDCYSGAVEAGVGEYFSQVFYAQLAELSLTRPVAATYDDLSAEAFQHRWLDATRKVCQSTAFCTSAEALESGPPRITATLSIVIDIIRRRSGAYREYMWASKARQAIGEKWLKVVKYAP